MIVVVRYIQNIYIQKYIYDNKYVEEVVSHISPIVKLLLMITTYNNNQFKFPTILFPSLQILPKRKMKNSNKLLGNSRKQKSYWNSGIHSITLKWMSYNMSSRDG